MLGRKNLEAHGRGNFRFGMPAGLPTVNTANYFLDLNRLYPNEALIPVFRRLFRIKKSISETNPTSLYRLSHRRQKGDLRNEPSFALRVVTSAPKPRLRNEPRFALRPVTVRLTERAGGNRR